MTGKESERKICKLTVCNGLLKADQDRATNKLLLRFAGSSNSHCEISISCLFLQSPCQVEMKNVLSQIDVFVVIHHSRNIPCKCV